MAEMEHDEYLQIWSTNAQFALECFGLPATTHEVIVLKDKPETARELEHYKPETKLFGIKKIGEGSYAGETERGRKVREVTLAACIGSLAFVANHSPDTCVADVSMVQGRPLWYVYANQAALDEDKGGTVVPTRSHWFAVISLESAS